MTEPRQDNNVDAAEIARFEALAERWWDTEGDFKPLHDINPARLEFIDERVGLAGRRVLDVGCGGGILAEAMAARGARVTAIDMAAAPLAVAQIHQRESGLEVEYLKSTAEAHAAARAGAYDVVTCLEMLEHVPDPSLVVAACARLTRPGGQVFFSTINRNPKAWVLAIVGAEYVLRLLPRGTHQYAKLIRPSELAAWIRAAGLELAGFSGMHYNPFTRACTLGGNVDVNYLAHCRKPEAG
jgi:2-polyprenyl-6-hydroxyphenyl methylase / 3-demethylubiquinone-9 3-methyltransferase